MLRVLYLEPLLLRAEGFFAFKKNLIVLTYYQKNFLPEGEYS